MLIYFQFYFYIFRNQHLPVKELFSEYTFFVFMVYEKQVI